MPGPKQKRKQVQLAVRISQDVHRAAKAAASMRGKSLADYVEDALFRVLQMETNVIKVVRLEAEPGKRGYPVLEVRQHRGRVK